MRADDKKVVLKMIKYCDDVESLKQKFNTSFELYETDIAFQYSCNMCIIQIGELVCRLSEEFKEQHPEIPWHAIRGMRNFHAHDYENIDLEIVWDAPTEDIPKLKSQLESCIL